MAHQHPHHHGHSHMHGHAGARPIAITLVLVVLYMAVEVVGGVLSGSLALLADAGHMLSDAGALALTLFAMRFARRPPTPQRTFGYHRAEILAALANGAALVAIAIFILIEAYERFNEPHPVEGPLMVAVAAGGLVVNAAGLWFLHHGREDSLNVHGAWLHVLSDALGSVQAIAAGALIWAYGWNWVDPLASVLIGALVIYSSWALIGQSVAVLMEGAPGDIDVDEVHASLRALPHVSAVHDLHVWTITSGFVALSAHLTCADRDEQDGVLVSAQALLADRFGIRHTTIQIDRDASCGRTPH